MKNISNILKHKLGEIPNPFLMLNIIIFKSRNLLEDPSGISLFMFYYSLLSKNHKHYDFAFETLEKVAEEYTDLSVISASLSKFGWLLYHLNQQEIIETDVEEIFQ